MPLVTVELNARKDIVGQPILWRLGKMFNVVTNILRARISDDYGYVALALEGSTGEVEQAQEYLRSLGVLNDAPGSATPRTGSAPEAAIAQPNTIWVRLTTGNAAQGHAPLLYRVGKDFNVVVNIQTAYFDDEEGGQVEITLAGALLEVQRAIAYLHTTGLGVNPLQRSVSDFGNL
jgi:hypothetical protein